MSSDYIITSKECEGFLIPSGEKIKLKKGTSVKITQSLGGDFTLYVNGNLIKISGNDADVIGQKISGKIKHNEPSKFDEKIIWEVLRTCYDPEIPVNIVDLGLIYDLVTKKLDNEKYYINIKMTLTAPGCGMGPVMAQDVETKISNLNFINDVLVEVVWEPLWNQEMMSEEAKLKLGMF
jgi:probable FeS assembly SUF system protein SufT